ncbi:MAG: phenylalanine 4-monooxygenase [Flavipsychrobacter sp.]
MQRKKPLVQQYDAYTPEDLEVWQLLFERQMALLKQYASPLYLDCVQQVGFHANEIPHFGKTNEALGKLSGWQLYVVPELVPQKEFFELLAKKIFPATCWLRSMQELDYIEEPDMFHDVFGHVPLLANKAYADFMEEFGKLALKWIDQPNAIALLGRIYWFTIEFGLLNNSDGLHVYGAGILSSVEETKSAVGDGSMKQGFDIAQMLVTDYRTDVVQGNYFTIESFEELYAGLNDIEAYLYEYINGNKVEKEYMRQQAE